MPTDILMKDARVRMKAGLDKAADLVKITIGAKGRNVSISQGEHFSPLITNDGLTIVKAIQLEDPFEQDGVSILKNVATATNETAGDGTTTSMVLTQALIGEGMKHLQNGANVMELKKDMQKASREVIEHLKSMSVPIRTLKEARQIAVISAEDEEMGKIVADTVFNLGKDSDITIVESPVMGITASIEEGMKIDSGYVSPYMSTNLKKLEAEYKDVAVLIVDEKIEAFNSFLFLAEQLIKSGKRSLVIFCEDFEGEALTSSIVNKTNGVLSILAVATNRVDMEDIATVTGATVISEANGVKLESASLEVLGKAKQIISTKSKTTIMGGDKKAIKNKVEELKAQNTDKRLDKRIARLTGGVAVIKVWAATEGDRSYLKLKVEDAVNATKSAMEEGIVIGGGSALVKVSEKIANSIVKFAIQEPLRQILRNAGKTDDQIHSCLWTIRQDMKNVGYDVRQDVFTSDMYKEGIIDPVKVTRTALENAVSAASTFLTTDGAIATKNEAK